MSRDRMSLDMSGAEAPAIRFDPAMFPDCSINGKRDIMRLVQTVATYLIIILSVVGIGSYPPVV